MLSAASNNGRKEEQAKDRHPINNTTIERRYAPTCP